AYGSGPFNSLVSISGNDNHYTSFGNPGTADANYNTILQAALYSNGEPMAFTWGGMTSGDTYLLEFWVNDGRNIGEARSETLTGGANTSAALSFGSDGSGPGQYIIGEFVADSTGTETVTLNPFSSGTNPSAQINLLQLRDLTPVPEPSTLALLAASTGAMFFGFRRKNREI
ncbi:MAG: PEP-CTERM sorting domain-containing protein, partial [Limisphaerales bacterium]